MSIRKLADGLGLAVARTGSIENRGSPVFGDDEPNGSLVIDHRGTEGGNTPPETPIELPAGRDAREQFRRDKLAKRASITEKIEALLAGQNGNTVSAETNTRFNELETEIRGVDRELDAVEKSLAADEPATEPRSIDAGPLRTRFQTLRNRPESVQRRTNPMAPHFVRDVGDKRSIRMAQMSFRNWVLPGESTDEYRAAAHESGFLPSRPLRVKLFEGKEEREHRMTTSAGYGGETVATAMADAIEVAMKAFNPLLDIAHIYRHAQGNPFTIPMIDDTGNDATLGVQGTAPTAVDITSTSKTLNSYRLERLVKATRELLRDTFYADLPGTVGRLLGESLGRKMASHHITGDGSSKPQGITIGCGTGITTAANNAITLYDIMQLIASVDLAYQAQGRFFMSGVMWANLLSLTDSTGRPLIGDLQSIDGRNIKGFPVELCPGMQTTISATTIPMLFGDPYQYKIRLIGDLEIMRFDELYAAEYSVGFMGVQFHDAKVGFSGAIKKMTQKT
jgi:HK97 family phage major capsid protein